MLPLLNLKITYKKCACRFVRWWMTSFPIYGMKKKNISNIVSSNRSINLLTYSKRCLHYVYSLHKKWSFFFKIRNKKKISDKYVYLLHTMYTFLTYNKKFTLTKNPTSCFKLMHLSNKSLDNSSSLKSYLKALASSIHNYLKPMSSITYRLKRGAITY